MGRRPIDTHVDLSSGGATAGLQTIARQGDRPEREVGRIT
jgi:hypothetical protein